MDYLTVPLNSSHKKKNFNCGKVLLANYLHKQAKQDIKRKLTACFVLTNKENNVLGYYTLSNAGIKREYLPEELKKKLLKSYNNLPVTLLGRLAVDRNSTGLGLGELLLIDALKRSYFVPIESIGSMAVIVDPIDEQAVNFYDKYGFIPLPDSGKMFLPMKTITKLFEV
ncbi:MAG TPA: GNAT family N-acetyltransferase [Ignavibacteria bacterium]|nr:GNAT family N-acetyltransferase [Ignavibacteria bacterium]